MKKYDTLVLSGGGVKGYTYLGIAKFLESKGLLGNILTYSGTSIGSIFCFLLILGYTYIELEHLFLNINLLKLKSFSLKNLFLRDTWGVNDNKNLIFILNLACKFKGVSPDITFKELSKTFYIVSTKLPSFEEVVFSNEITPNVKIIDAIQASINIPIFFNKYNLNGIYYIDGGFTNNFPIEYVANGNNIILGVLLPDKKDDYINKQNKIELNNVFDYTISLFKGIHIQYGEFQRQKLVKYQNNDNISLINVNIPKNQTINFDISLLDKIELIKLGWDAINRQIK